jgi:hypothetical protein
MTFVLLRPGLAAATVALCCTSPLFAQTSTGPQAAAEALFEQGQKLIDSGQIAEACEKLAASQELDPRLGTQLHLADCYDRAGRTASAWALFREVQERSRRAGQTDREQIARERASALEARLSRLELRVAPARQEPELMLTLAGTTVPKASWNVPLPVDPGSFLLEARAPGKKPWSMRVTIQAGPASQVVELPALGLAPVAAKATVKVPARVEPPSPGSGHRTLGWISSGLGAVALVAGGILGYRAYSLDKSSKTECRDDEPNACTARGAELRDQARGAAQLATLSSVGGGLLAVAGVTLVLTAPTRQAEPVASNLSMQLRGMW